MTAEKRLYRSRNALVGGVCAGVAEYFNFDPVVARILTVVFTLSTAGLFAVAYVALWVVLPLAPSAAGPVEVQPHSVRSDTYGQVDFDPANRRVDDAARAAAEVASARQHLPYDAYAGTGHIPPEPPTPEAAAWARQAYYQVPPAPPGAPGVPGMPGVPRGAGASAVPAVPTAPGMPGVPQTPVPPTAPGMPGVPQTPLPPGASVPPTAGMPQTPAPAWASHVAPSAPPVQRTGGVKAAVFIGSFLLFFGIAALLADNIDGVLWWQFWPLVLAIIGIVRMVVPGEPGHRMAQFVEGFNLFCLGGTLLPLSLGVVSWITVQIMVMNLWPLLVIMGGFYIIGGALHLPWFTLAAGLCFALFCVGGLMLFAVPGPNDLIVLTLPFGREFIFPFEITLNAVH